MGWGDKAVSPCVWTPMAADAGGMSLSAGLTLGDGRLGPAIGFEYYLYTSTHTPNPWNHLIGELLLYNHDDALFSPTGMTGLTKDGVTLSTPSNSNGQIWAIFNGSASYYQSTTGLPVKIKVAFPSVHALKKVAMLCAQDYPHLQATGFTIEGSHTGAFAGEQTLLFSVTGLSWTNGERKEWTL